MAENTKIEWTDHTYNHWIGCTKVSPGCAHCYAATLDANRFSKTMDGGTKEKPVSHWGKGAPRHRTKTASEVRKWNAVERFHECENCHHRGVMFTGCHECGSLNIQKARQRVFCSSLSDWLDDEVPIEWLAELLALIYECQNLDFLTLTKRTGQWRPRISEAIASIDRALFCDEQTAEMLTAWLNGKAPANVWMGTTVEDQAHADERIPQLLAIPARVRFLSCEPLLGPVDFRKVPGFNKAGSAGFDILRGFWVIAGGESGKDARPMHPDWACGLRDQCAAAGVPFLFKQWGEWAPAATHAFGDFPRAAGHVFHDRVLDGVNFGTSMLRVGKHAAGRLLDGIEHNGFPA